jgi:uncharacterized protein YoxC
MYAAFVVIVVSFIVLGCATKGDLERVKSETESSMSQKLNGQIDALKAELRGGFEALQKRSEERERPILQDLKEKQAKLTEMLARMTDLAKDSAELRTTVKALNKSLSEFLKAEETHLRARLKSMDLALKDMGLPEEKPKTVAP